MIFVILALVVVAAIGTVMVGLKPKESGYGTRTKKNLTRLIAIYAVCTVIFLGIFIYYFNK
ncbi:hypothetical protein [Brevibacillus daliensis]|uniref:hypothetical protein n=1 Tax=Brevibacillus daliensis TaxID=2892995 RepID=UPI001E549BC1|nr:hypothetical protein [Brevibacillus daliensis]